MSSIQHSNFKHSVPVPRIYKVASKVARNVKEGKDSLKNLVYQEKHVNIKTVYALIVETFRRDGVIDDLIRKSELLVNEPRLDPWLAKILICEMLWGKNKMKGDSKPVQTILGYETKLKNLLSEINDVPVDVLKHNILKPRYVRVNTLKVTMEEAVNNFRDEGWVLVPFLNKLDYAGFLERLSNLETYEFMIDLHIPDLLIFPPKTEFYRHEAYKSRSIILQDKASCLPVYLLNPTPGSTVIDMCAAPGMKTTQLAAILKDSGTLHAVELDKNREKILRQFVESSGATCVKTILKDVMKVTDTDCPGVEYVLVDPSCSGSGITDRIEVEDLNFSNKIQRLKKLCGFQAKLLRHAITSFPQAKRVVYSTCSLNTEENEDVVRQVLETSKNFKLVDAKKLLKSWNDSGSEIFPELGKMCVYATPEKDKTNGFFVAVLERLADGEKNPYLNVQLCKMFDREYRTPKRHGNPEMDDYSPKKKFKNEKKYEDKVQLENDSNIKYDDYSKDIVQIPEDDLKMEQKYIKRQIKIETENEYYMPYQKGKYHHNNDKFTHNNFEDSQENIKSEMVKLEIKEELESCKINNKKNKKKKDKMKIEEGSECIAEHWVKNSQKKPDKENEELFHEISTEKSHHSEKNTKKLVNEDESEKKFKLNDFKDEEENINLETVKSEIKEEFQNVEINDKKTKKKKYKMKTEAESECTEAELVKNSDKKFEKQNEEVLQGISMNESNYSEKLSRKNKKDVVKNENESEHFENLDVENLKKNKKKKNKIAIDEQSSTYATHNPIENSGERRIELKNDDQEINIHKKLKKKKKDKMEKKHISECDITDNLEAENSKKSKKKWKDGIGVSADKLHSRKKAPYQEGSSEQNNESVTNDKQMTEEAVIDKIHNKKSKKKRKKTENGDETFDQTIEYSKVENSKRKQISIDILESEMKEDLQETNTHKKTKKKKKDSIRNES